MDKDILDYLKKYKEKNEKKYHIKRLGIFGSYVKEKYNNKSDIDIVVDFSKPDLLSQVAIMNDLKKYFNKKIDVIAYWDKMNPRLKKRIEKEAIYV
jgi:predicted nucleotidyltransferase